MVQLDHDRFSIQFPVDDGGFVSLFMGDYHTVRIPVVLPSNRAVLIEYRKEELELDFSF